MFNHVHMVWEAPVNFAREEGFGRTMKDENCTEMYRKTEEKNGWKRFAFI